MTMTGYQNNSAENLVNGWTRIDMLLALYDRAIAAVLLAKKAVAENDANLLASATLETNKYILALHSGLNVEADPVAENVARLLTFVMTRFEEQNFDEAVLFLEKLRSSFDQIREEATALEKAGKIPPLNSEATLNTVA